jgi:hypothetical protein
MLKKKCTAIPILAILNVKKKRQRIWSKNGTIEVHIQM